MMLCTLFRYNWLIILVYVHLVRNNKVIPYNDSFQTLKNFGQEKITYEFSNLFEDFIQLIQTKRQCQ